MRSKASNTPSIEEILSKRDVVAVEGILADHLCNVYPDIDAATCRRAAATHVRERLDADTASAILSYHRIPYADGRPCILLAIDERVVERALAGCALV